MNVPDRGYTGRMRVYLAEMFPLPSRIFSAILVHGSFTAILCFLHRTRVSFLSFHSVVGYVSFLAMMLIPRLMDEFKDRDIDRRLFAHRPLPSGRVLESDIRTSLGVAVVLYVAVNLAAGPAIWTALVVLGYSFLMFRFFFIPRLIRQSLLLALVTHSPVVPLIFLHALALFAAEHRFGLQDLRWPTVTLVIGMYWIIFVGWEISRKIRSQAEEDAYETYSRIFGQRVAALLALGAQTVALGIGLAFWWQLSLSGLFAGIWLCGYGVALWGTLRFIGNPDRSTSRLRPFAEVAVLAAASAIFIEFGFVTMPGR